jgi:hypothetical protein
LEKFKKNRGGITFSSSCFHSFLHFARKFKKNPVRTNFFSHPRTENLLFFAKTDSDSPHTEKQPVQIFQSAPAA